jgi:uncharacterized protein involved in type VI secretion and phage assembly
MSERLGNLDFTDCLQSDGRVYGVLTGVVIKNDSSNDNSKPGPGKIKVEIPIIGMKESNWARIASFVAGKGKGAFFLPEVGEEVLVAFENGDVNKPYIIGFLWNGKDLPPETSSITTLSGHRIQFFDKKNEEKIVIKSSKGHVIQMDDKNGSENIQISDKSGNNKIIINTTGIEICAPKGKLVLDAKNIEIKASADMVIKGATVKINGKMAPETVIRL